DDVSGLGGAVSIALVPSGDWLFVAGPESNGVAVFGRDLVTGELTFLDSVFQGDIQGDPGSEVTVDGLAGVRAIAARETAPDVMVYTAGLADDQTTGAVARFVWDTTDQALKFEEIVLDGDDLGGNLVDGLGGAAGLALADAFLYVAAADDNQLTSFSDAPGLGLVQSFADGGGGIGPGETDPGQWVQYTITVSNLGPSQVTDAVVTDMFPPEFEDISWTCSVQLADGNDNHTSCQIPSGSGDLEETVDIAVGGSVIFSATGRVRPEMTGTLSNTATVDAPEGLIDPDLGNNADTDDDTLLTPHADVMIHKMRLGAPIPGEDLTYVITVTNNGPSFALHNTVSDVLPEALVSSTWSCEALPPPGLLEPTVGGYDSLNGASGLAITSDKTFLFAVGSDGSELMVLKRDSRTGALTLMQALTDGVDGVDGTGGALAVALSPNDNNVYVAGEIDDAIAVFSRDAASGELTLLEVQRDGIGLVNGLGGVRNLALSPDGRNLYAAGAADSAVAVFERDGATGALTYSEILQQGVDGVDGLAGVSDVALSHDGAHLYAAGPLSDAVAVFERQPSTGELLFIEMVSNGDVHDLGMVEGLGGAAGLAVSADDTNVYIVGESDNALAVFSRDTSTGELAFIEFHQSGSNGVSGIDGPLAVTLSDDDGQVYVAGAGSNSVAAFARAADGSLAFLNAFDAAGGYTGLAGVRDLVPCGGGKHLYAASRLDGEVVLLARQLGSTCAADGVGDISDTVDLIPFGTATYTVTGRLIPGATGELVNTARVSPGPTVADPDDSNNQSTTIDNQIEPQADLRVTKDDGLLEVNAGEALTYQIEVFNNGPSDVYGATVGDLFPIFPTETAGLSEGSIAWTCVATNSLIPFETHVDTIDGIDGLEGTSWVVASPDPDGPGGETGGDHLYVTGTAAGALSTFAFNSGTGAFEQAQVLHDEQEIDGVTLNGLAGASGLAFSPDGRHLFVAATADNSVAVFERDADPDSPDYGDLVFVQTQIDGTPVQGLVGAIDVAVSPDGVHVYVVSKESDSIMVYVRDPATGMLTYSQRKTEGSDDVPLIALDGVRDLVFTPDGTHLYVAAQNADAVTVFLRDPASGHLTFVDVVRNLDMQGSVTVNGLDFVRSLALSPGGVYLYAVSLADDAIVVFERNRDAGSAEYGHLTFLEVYRDNVGLIDGLDGATAVTISPDGAYLFAAGFNDDAVAVFRRNWTDGSLTIVELAQDGMPGVDALNGVSGLTVTPDGTRLLSTAVNDNALTIFERTAEGACDASGTPGLLGELNETVDLTAGATAIFVVQATVDTGARGTLFNQAGVISPLLDPDLLNNLSADDDTVITVFTDLGVTKDDGTETAIAGLPLSYSIVVSNAGPALAYGITVADTLPPMLLGCTCSRSDAQPCTIDGTNTLTDVIDLDAGASLTFTVDCLLDPATAIPVTNTVTVTA
ncbi:MAG: beta-propeller fold lactonase family protein, partial [Acidobacteria bacterium]|nr:beta-propeller fold lactonase family protein [Acidobacteriota bacterium]